jgi:DNA-binding NarL/FixJ family response regulator
MFTDPDTTLDSSPANIEETVADRSQPAAHYIELSSLSSQKTGPCASGIEKIIGKMPKGNGLRPMLAIRREFPVARFIVLTTYQGDVQALRARKAGATGCLLKSMLREDMITAVRKVHAGGRFIPAEIAATLAEHANDDALSDREIEVLRKVAAGASNKIIAAQLELFEATVKSHLKNIISKLGANSRTHAVTIATARGFLDG